MGGYCKPVTGAMVPRQNMAGCVEKMVENGTLVRLNPPYSPPFGTN